MSFFRLGLFSWSKIFFLFLLAASCGGECPNRSTPAGLSIVRPGYVFSTKGPSASIAPTLAVSSGLFKIAPALPNGLSLNVKNGVISGIPTLDQAETLYTLTATNTTGSVSTEFTIEVITAFYVDSNLDTSDQILDGICLTSAGVCTLRAAIEESNSLAGTQSILIGENTTVILASALQISSSIKIFGQDQDTVIISGNDAVRIFEFTSTTHTSTLKNFTLRDGLAVSGKGGALTSSGGSLTLQLLKFLENTCDTGCDGGGAIGISDGTNTLTTNLTIEKCLFQSNTAWAGALGGGGVFFDGTGFSIKDSEFSSNTTPPGFGLGGGMVSFDAVGSIERSTFKENYAQFGGGLTFLGGTHTIKNLSFFSNSANAGAGLAIDSSGVVTGANLTFLGQVSAINGGAILVSNSLGAGTLNLSNTLFSENIAGVTPNDCWVVGTLNSLGGNITSVDPATSNCGFATGTGDLLSTSVNLATPADNGGFVLTAAIEATSAARNAGVAQYCPTEDARGIARATGQCDVGAYEY